MHISNISGHRSASLAIEKAIKIQSPQSQILTLNAFKYMHPHAEKIVNFFYLFVIKKLPFIWSYLYDNSFWIKKTDRIKGFIHNFDFSKLDSLINDFHPDVVVSTQAFPCGIVADFKRIRRLDLSLIAVLTDFVPHSYWIYDNINCYVTPSEEVKQRLIQKGINEDRIKTLGIPFDPKFNKILSKAEIRKKLNLKEGVFTILIMGGGQGLGPIKNIVKIIDNLKIDLQEIIVCGSNKRLYYWLKRKSKSYKKSILLLGYVQNIEELMSAADLIITKPGGVTCAEALSKGLPMIITCPIPGQEANNTSYLISKRAAIKVSYPEELEYILNDLHNHPEKLRKLSKKALEISKPNAAADIAQLILDL